SEPCPRAALPEPPGRPRSHSKASTPMSTIPQPAVRPPGSREITIVSHSGLFYWWPVWAIGFLLALVTLFDSHRMAIVPKDSVVATDAKGKARLDDKGR